MKICVIGAGAIGGRSGRAERMAAALEAPVPAAGLWPADRVI